MFERTQVLDHFRQGPAIFEEALRGLREEDATREPAPGKWSIRQLARHVADTEIVAGMRIRQMLAENRPTLIPFDQDLWAANLGYRTSSVEESLATFRALRADTAKLLDNAPEDAFARIGVHPERGEKTLGEWVALFAKHVESHSNQILAIRKQGS